MIVMANRSELADWVYGLPGPFSGRTIDSVWNAAWRNFNEGMTGQCHSQLGFMIALGKAGIDVRPTGLGGYVLTDRKS